MERTAVALMVLAVPAVAMKCPGSPAFMHASCQVTVSFLASCDTVRAEVAARIAGENGWLDPHNRGNYSLVSEASGVLEASRLTGDGKFTDRMTLTFEATGSGCSLEACSESQGTSLLDFSTNYCNLHDLYCGASDGCPIARQDLSGYSETVGKCRQHDKNKCVVKKQAAPTQARLRVAPEPVVGKCQPVSTQPNFNLTTFISKRWYAQQQMPVLYLPASQNFCVWAEYRMRTKPTTWGYTISVHNHAQDEKGRIYDSGDNLICAKLADPIDPAKLEVGLCLVPAVVGIFSGPYWIVAYNEEEGYALVSGGQPFKETSAGCRTGSFVTGAGLWVFTRQQQRDPELVEKVRGIAQAQGFDLGVLNDVDQSHCSPGEELSV